MTSLKYAIIGCGRISPNHISSAISNNLDIVAICDLEQIKMDYIINHFQLPKAVNKYTDYHEMLKKEHIDLIAICTESGKHGQIALDCIEAGSHLIIEKPITLSLEEADQIIKLSKLYNVKVSACHQNRFN